MAYPMPIQMIVTSDPAAIFHEKTAEDVRALVIQFGF